ncbi:hypothetical protein HC762_01870 [bacterium]|nr:hypothetical protein [bacterium]
MHDAGDVVVWVYDTIEIDSMVHRIILGQLLLGMLLASNNTQLDRFGSCSAISAQQDGCLLDKFRTQWISWHKRHHPVHQVMMHDSPKAGSLSIQQRTQRRSSRADVHQYCATNTGVLIHVRVV